MSRVAGSLRLFPSLCGYRRKLLGGDAGERAKAEGRALVDERSYLVALGDGHSADRVDVAKAATGSTL